MIRIKYIKKHKFGVKYENCIYSSCTRRNQFGKDFQ